MELHTVGVDLDETVFHLVGLNLRGEVPVRKKFRVRDDASNNHTSVLASQLAAAVVLFSSYADQDRFYSSQRKLELDAIDMENCRNGSASFRQFRTSSLPLNVGLAGPAGGARAAGVWFSRRDKVEIS
jgi:hypothetical protein